MKYGKKEYDFNASIERVDFFRNIQVWPLKNIINYKGWLDNFSQPNEKEIAARILDFFIFYPSTMVNQLLKTVVGYCGGVLKSHFPNWQHNDFTNKCLYSFIPGETNSITDSGHIYVRKLRNELHIPEEHIIRNEHLFQILENISEPIPVIFVDDFVGSGAQCITAWNGDINNPTIKPLKEIALKTNHIFIYAPLVSNHIGYNRIKDNCENLSLVTCHILNQNYNLFDPSCICWMNDNDLFLEGTNLLLEKSKELGIPFTNGNKTVDVKGFDNQGLAIAFDDDGVPDAIPAILYWCDDKWTPLIKKEYKR